MTSSTSTVAVFGATGNVGKAVLSRLMEQFNDELEEIRIVTRRPGEIKATATAKTPKLCIVEGNCCSDKKAVLGAMKGCNRVLVILPQSLSSAEMIQCGKFLGECAVQAGVSAIIRLSSFGIDEKSAKYVGSQGPLGEAHVTLEQYYEDDLGLQVVSIRPTSFFSNIQFNLEEIQKHSTMSTPLGTIAKVNWISCEDIAAVMAKVLTAKTWDVHGTIIDVTGPEENTLSGSGVTDILTKVMDTNQPISYQETDLPPVPDYAGLWKFLRNGGFDCHTDTVPTITLQRGVKFKDIVIE